MYLMIIFDQQKKNVSHHLVKIKNRLGVRYKKEKNYHIEKSNNRITK